MSMDLDAKLNHSDLQNLTKQCISCNREMPISSESCICGHVLSDIKSLEGKRYSGYREELYSRLEIKRILQDHAKPRRPRLKQAKTIPAKQDYVTRTTLHKPQMKRRHKRKSPSNHLVAPTKHYSTYKGNNVRLSEQSKDFLNICEHLELEFEVHHVKL
ncbi:uncharacterized protein LOC124439504 isoform X2 [Xenia sp. Carnegie-2017]|uniref:uncharacterized protein LOC124439504 isoform X2 n=1 Tax=Xenia sp. Carnegie-2017 TaxID=2897299 RepID=UPI001F03AC22|nr:uncharacterized protein LOC124439504 isoform X2 [Xenia sp. Carnegie-2017]